MGMGVEEDGNPLSRIHLDRRQFLGASGVVAAEATLAGPNSPILRQVLGDNSLENVGGALVDKALIESNHPLFASIRFFYDVEYNQGSIASLLILRTSGVFRVVSQEQSPDPRFLVNLPFERPPGGYVKYPVIQLNIGDVEKIWFGSHLQGEPCEQTYQDMLTYQITREMDGTLSGRSLGRETLDPATIIRRPSEPERFFNPDCPDS